jgi:hypothetical protein
MPKLLKKETPNEVDGSPLVYNAWDYNRHMREIRAIECSLLGSSYGTGILDILTRAETVTEEIKRGGLMLFFSGTVPSESQVPVPDRVTWVTIQGPLLGTDTAINVNDVTYLPSSGYFTKINTLSAHQYCTSNSPVGAGDRCDSGVKYMAYDQFLGGASYITSQEFITYDGLDKANNRLLNCTRGVDGTTVQDLVGNAIGIAGWASISLTHNAYARQLSIKPNQFYVTHDEMLNVYGALLEEGTSTRVKDPISEISEIAYSWAIVGNFSSLGIGTGFSCQV